MTSTPSVQTPTKRQRRRALIAANTGTFVEYFDFGLYAVFATVLAKEFFPATEGLTGLLATFAVYSVSFLFRPLGSIVFGHFGDKQGRKNILATVVILMSLATFLMGIIPNFAAIGAWAPILLIVLRAIQGFSAGGEWGGATTFLAEYAPPRKRGVYCGTNLFSVMTGTLLGLLIGVATEVGMDDASLHSWGWRIGFLLALPLGLAGLYLRMRLEETPAFANLEMSHEVEKAPLLVIFTRHWRPMLTVVGLTLCLTAMSYMLSYMTSYLISVRKVPSLDAAAATAAGFALAAAITLMTAKLSDRIGRRPVLLSGALFSLAAMYPVFVLTQGSIVAVFTSLLLLGASIGILGGPFPAAVAELFPTEVRYSGLGIAYGVATSFFGGLSPLLMTWLITQTGSTLAPAYYGLAAAFVTLIAIAFGYREPKDKIITISPGTEQHAPTQA